MHDQPKEETNETQAGASRVKIAGLIRKTSLKWSRSIVQAKTSQILTTQDRLLKTIILPSSGSAFLVRLLLGLPVRQAEFSFRFSIYLSIFIQ